MTGEAIARVKGVSHRYGATVALDDVTIDIPVAQHGRGDRPRRRRQVDPARADRRRADHPERRGRRLRRTSPTTGNLKEIRARIAYMPQGLGRNLYPTLSVFENIDFFGRLFGQRRGERRERITELLTATALDPFEDRPAGKLSGGMKQKLSLCCALINDPDLLILDEPTTGVDPLSRGQFWDLINTIRGATPADERDRRDRLHGRSAALRLADGDGRRQDHRHGHAEGTARQDGENQRSTKPSSRCCRRTNARCTRRSSCGRA